REDLGVLFQLFLVLGGFSLRAFEVNQFLGNLLPVAALDAVETNPIAFDLIFADEMVRAVVEIQLQVGGPERRASEEKESNPAHILNDYCSATGVSVPCPNHAEENLIQHDMVDLCK